MKKKHLEIFPINKSRASTSNKHEIYWNSIPFEMACNKSISSHSGTQEKNKKKSQDIIDYYLENFYFILLPLPRDVYGVLMHTKFSHKNSTHTN